MPFWDEKTETLSIGEIKDLQLKKLKHMVDYCYNLVPFYRKKFDEIGLKPKDIRSLDDTLKIPFTTKKDLRDNYPFNMLAVPMTEIVRVHASSGTTGKPTVIAYTRGDLDSWTELMARELFMVGVRSEDVVQLIYNYAFFTGGLGFNQGAERIGAAVIPAGVGNTKKQLKVMCDFKTTVFSSTPSYALHVAEVMKDIGFKKDDLSLKTGVFGAEPWTEPMRKRIEEGFGINAFDNYGLSEMCGPGVSIECEEKNGMHLWADHFLAEIIDWTGNTSDSGELILSTLNKQALPLLRYRTGDLTSFIDEMCPCGRTHKRITRIMGRVDDMLIIKGVNVFPSQIENIILGFPEIGDNYQLIVGKERHMDTLTVKIEVNHEVFSAGKKELERLRGELMGELKSGLDVGVDVDLVKPLSLERSMGKAKRVVDLRKE